MSIPVFATSLRWYREQAGLTQARLAAIAGTSRPYISRCEAGRYARPHERTLRALAKALGVPAVRLLEPPPLHPEPPAGDRAPAGPAGLPCEPPSPEAATQQGTRLPPQNALEREDAGEGTPAAATPAAGPHAPGPVVAGRSAAGPGSTLAERQKDQRAAIRAAKSALAKTQRQQRARPWSSRDPFRNAVPGGRKLPPGGESR